MPKLTRYLQKIFANNSNEVGVFGTGVDKETSKNVETLQSSDYEEGWSSAIITNKNYPIWQEMDGVQYGLSYQLKYLFQNGIPEWLNTETYYENSYCRVGSTIYYSLQDNNTNHNPALQDGWWTPLLTSSRSIGEIIPSTIPLTEAGLHLLDGALISSGMYADFVTYMANLTATAPDCFCTEQEWQTAVTTYGVCGKFVYDSVNNTVRLPKITGIIEGTTDLTALGDLVQAGLPNISGVLGPSRTLHTYSGTSVLTSGAFKKTSISGTTVIGGASNSADVYKYEIDASLSNSIYGNSSTVQPQTIKVLYYIVIATSTKTDIQVDIDEIATDLNGKMDTDGTNAVNSVKFADGQWVKSYSALALSVTQKSSDGAIDYSLSSYLPNDNYDYEVFISGWGQGSASNSGAYCWVTSDLIGDASNIIAGSSFDGCQIFRGSGTAYASGCAIVPVGSARKVAVYCSNASNATINVLALAYRRLGTNQ